MMQTPVIYKTPPTTVIRPHMLFEAAIERISAAYSKENAKQDGIYYWPDPLPTPTYERPDPLILFSPEDEDHNHAEMEQVQVKEYQAIIPMTRGEVLERRSRENIKPSMQIPLGLIDKPEEQVRDTFLVDLHGAAGALTGGPLLVAGAQHSGKATVLQTMLLWLTTRFLPGQLRCAVIDPFGELDQFHGLPHFYNANGDLLWTDGGTEEQLTHFINNITTELQRRREAFPNQHWNTHTLSQLWSQGITHPQFLLIISNYQSFAERISASMALKKLAMTIIESRTAGNYLVITTSETGSRYIPPEIMSKCSTKIGLALNDQQRNELFGRTPFIPEAISGRGLIITPERKVHQVQLALPTTGKSESLRDEHLKNELARTIH
ncbi:FtsK/SpoIIIE domain-containing protein [Dictyobacter kobayashii]|uniref:FtsK domain-containing protein n=1 Tax=Dictyobacter kobayashii TaxID=2014872 RepID=A0A402AK08_9CHLR|nr:FtsK/SpoIIIE domain-containing protein [Dictyobacter kobayashii]GCE19413.1 hypothetical protein KDK_32130 [Dictyobacter kobayashii]